MKRVLICILACFFLPGAFWFESLFAPATNLWPRWERHEPNSALKIDHSQWDSLLKTYVHMGPDGVTRFAYSRLSAADENRLNEYVRRLAAMPISDYTRREQLAYWINLYNSLTVQVILAHFPVNSIREIELDDAGWVSGPWGAKLVTIQGEELSLNDIEHRILRPIWRDPRIHYAINCASVGCPNLRQDAYEGDTVNRILQSAARDFINNRRAVTLEDGDVIVSSIYVWFRPDFGASDKAVLKHLRRYSGPTLRAALKNRGTIEGHRFDWRLNSTD